MTVRYELSKKQRAAMEDGEPLRLAIPVLSEYGKNPDYLECVRGCLDVPLVKGCIGVSNVFCSLVNRGGGERSLQSYMGEIIDFQKIEVFPCYSVPVIVVSINGGKAPTRWPSGPVVLEESDGQ